MVGNQYTLEDSVERIKLAAAWQRVMDDCKERFAEHAYNRFLSPLKPIDMRGDVAIVHSHGHFVHEYVTANYKETLEKSLSGELGREVTIELQPGVVRRDAAPAKSESLSRASSDPQGSRIGFEPRKDFKFENFVKGQSNRMALAGAEAVASHPGGKYNPLFIYGPAGLGKTHLMHAIAHEVMANHPTMRVAYVTAQVFAEQFVESVKGNSIEGFRRLYRQVDVWLIDDVQFIAGKEKTAEELVHTFNALHDSGGQVVFCSDKPPRELNIYEARIVSRFESGLVADIQLPDIETRCAILLSKATEIGVRLDHEIAMFLAQAVPGNVRVLTGLLTRLIAESSMNNVSINRDLAEELVRREYNNLGVAKPTLKRIIEVVARHSDVEVDEIKGPSRRANIARARHIAMYLSREITGESWQRIGDDFGRRDHTTVIHAWKKIDKNRHHDRQLSTTIRTLRNDLLPADRE